jgi:hypothetical protein
MRKLMNWALAGGSAVVLLIASVAPSTAQTAPTHLVQGGDGTLYVVSGSTRYAVSPDAISDEDLATLNDGGNLGSQLTLPSTPAPTPVSAPPVSAPAAPTSAASTPAAQPTAAQATDNDVVVERVAWVPVGSNGQYIIGAALLRNPNNNAWLPTVPATATAFDASGNVLATDSGYVALGPGEERWILINQMSAPASKVARVDYQIRRDKSFRAAADPAPPLTVVQSTTQPGQFSGRQVGQVRNDGTTAASQVRIDILYFGAQGQLLGTAYTYVNNLEAGQTASFSASGPSLPQQGVTDIKTYASAPLARIGI